MKQQQWITRSFAAMAALVLALGTATDSADAYQVATGTTANVNGTMTLTFSLTAGVTITVDGHTSTTVSGAGDVDFGAITINAGGCSAAPSTGACSLVASTTPTQVNLVADLEATVDCSGWSTFDMWVFRDTEGGLTGLPTGRVRYTASAASTSTPTTLPGTDWTVNGNGAVLDEFDKSTFVIDTTEPSTGKLVTDGTCQTTYVGHELAARVLSTDTAGSTTPITYLVYSK